MSLKSLILRFLTDLLYLKKSLKSLLIILDKSAKISLWLKRNFSNLGWMEKRINLCFLLIKDSERELAQRVEDLTEEEGQNLLL